MKGQTSTSKRSAARPLVVHIAAECSPFIKVGGLADVVGSLPQALQSKVTNVVIIPLPRAIRQAADWKLVSTIIIPLGLAHRERVRVYTLLHRSGVRYYGLQHSLFEGAIYSLATDLTLVEKFTFFSLAAVNTLASLLPETKLVHCHDWHTGLVPTFLDTTHQAGQLKNNIPSVFTIHNIAYQGLSKKTLTKTFKLKPAQELALMEDYYDDDQLNLMKIAILSADKITTVSPRYARELLTVEQPGGLATFLNRRKKDLSGIINGIDLESFDPATDRALVATYNKKTWRPAKKKNKNSLRRQLGLASSALPLVGIVGRLVEQKGIDLIVPALEQLLSAKLIQCVIVGSGDSRYEHELQELQKKYPQSLALKLGFDDTLARRIYGSCDFFLMPSHFEPCGLGQMIAMRYGTVPIVRATGGLADTVHHLKTGIVFKDYAATALIRAIKQAINLYQNPQSWYTMVSQDMAKDSSWKASAKKYYQLYQTLL